MRRLRQIENEASGQTRIAFHQSMKGRVKSIDIGAWWGARGRGKYTVFLERTPSRYLTEEGKLEKICNTLTPMYETEGRRFGVRERASTFTTSYCAGDANNFKVCFPQALQRNACEIRRGRFKCNILLVDAVHETSPVLQRRVEHCYENAFDRIAIPDASDIASLRYPAFQKGADLQYCMRDDGFCQDFILYERRERYEFAFVLEMYHLAMQKAHHGGWIIYHPDSENMERPDTFFYVTEPQVTDANHNEIPDASFSLEQITDTPNRYLMTIKLNAETLSDMGASFPITMRFRFVCGSADTALPVSVTQYVNDAVRAYPEAHKLGYDGGRKHSLQIRLRNPYKYLAFTAQRIRLEQAYLLWKILSAQGGGRFDMKVDGRSVGEPDCTHCDDRLDLCLSGVVDEMLRTGKCFTDILLEPQDTNEAGCLVLAEGIGSLGVLVDYKGKKNKKSAIAKYRSLYANFRT